MRIPVLAASWFTAVAVAVVVVVAACSSPGKPPPPGPGGLGNGAIGGAGGAGDPGSSSAGAAGSGSGGAPAPAPPPIAGGIGDACKPDPANPRGTCAVGQLCFPAPGGYCTSPCGATGAPCPAGSACLPSVRGPEMCARSCATDADCRADQGYICDPGRKACSLPFLASISLPACPAAAPPDGGFSAPVALSTKAMPGVYQFEPAAVLTPAGDLVVVYTSGGSIFGKSFLGVARVPQSGAPVIDQPLPTTKQQHFDAWAAVTRDGAVHAVWLGHDGGGVDRNAEIGYARSTDGGATWSQPVAIHAPEDCPPDTRFCLDKPMIAAGPVPGKPAAGKPAAEALRAFYSSETGGGLRMRTSLDGGKTWDAPVTATEGAYGDVAIDGQGRVHVAVAVADPRGVHAWGSPDNTVAYSVSADGKTFGKPITVTAPGEAVPFYFLNPTLAVDDRRGWIYVAYAAGTPDGKWDIRLAATKDGGKTWKRTKVNDDETCANHMVPNLALDPASGTLHVTFFENRGGKGHLAYTTCKPAGGPCAPTVRASPDMAAYELARHSSKWLGEYGALLIDPKRKLVHSVWTHTGQEGEHAIGRLRHATRKLDR
ncbi:MAG TPA: sialidase family protein [Kofleriaceae bacterium]|nr:sialidase family protein [Kofleriaceae bacterium]